jgi:integrase
MGGKTAKLADVTIRTAKPSSALRKLADGRGLQLWITPQGGRYWRWEYRFHGKRKLLALGTYPDVSAADARREADKARKLLRDGVDPSDAKRQTKFKAALAVENAFDRIAAKLVAKKRKGGTAKVTLDKMQWILGKVRQDLGHRPMASITTPEIIAVLSREADADNLETARRMRTVIGEVFRYAIQHGIVEHDPVAATRGAIATPKPKHFAAVLEPEAYGDLLRCIDDYATRNVVTGSALQLMALLYPRPGELRQAQWSEFDLAKGTWEIPASRMKLRQPHTKALPRQAIAILKALHQITGPTGNVFPAVGRAANPLSENTMNAALRRMGIAANVHSSHGFRATASTLLNASNLFSADAIEHSLAHQDKDAVRRAYARGDAMTERKKMAQWWADYLDRLREPPSGENVLPLKRTK